MKLLFAESFTPQIPENELAAMVLKNIEDIDQKIQAAATAWPIEKLNKIDLAILRLAVYELDEGKEPPKVVIDEAVEIAKEYGSEASSSFVNGVLGKIYKSESTK